MLRRFGRSAGRRQFGCGFGWRRCRRDLRVHGPDEAPRLLVRGGEQDRPNGRIESRRGKYGRGHGESIRSEIFEQAQWQRQGGDRARRCRTERLVDPVRFAADRLKRFGNSGTVAVRSRAGDKVHELPPPHGRVVTVFGRLVEHRQQTIVEAHCLLVSSGRTLLSLYARIDIALRSKSLTAP